MLIISFLEMIFSTITLKGKVIVLSIGVCLTHCWLYICKDVLLEKNIDDPIKDHTRNFIEH